MSALTRLQTIEASHVITQYDTGWRDGRGRAIGLSVSTYEVDFVLPEPGEWAGYTRAPGHYFGFVPQATRNGQYYGSCNPEKFFATAAEREAAIAKYRKAFMSRAPRIRGAKS